MTTPYEMNIGPVRTPSPAENEHEWRDLIQWLVEIETAPDLIRHQLKNYLALVEERQREIEELQEKNAELEKRLSKAAKSNEKSA